MPHRTRPMAALLLFTGLNVILVSTITPVYDFVCFLPYWERRVPLVLDRMGKDDLRDRYPLMREHRRQKREAALTRDSA